MSVPYSDNRENFDKTNNTVNIKIDLEKISFFLLNISIRENKVKKTKIAKPE